MQPSSFEEVVEQIVAKDPRYHRDAYLFVREALDYAQQLSAQKDKRDKAHIHHISGQELLEGIRLYGLEQFGPMTAMVLAEWGIHRCEDFGEIVFNMIDFKLLCKTEKDSRDDFKGGYDFNEAFRKPFLPPRKRVGGQPAPERSTRVKS